MRKPERGFIYLGLLFVGVAILVVAICSWFVWHQNANKKTSPETVKTTPQPGSSLFVKEWGVSLNPPSGLGIVKYQLKESNVISFHSSLQDNLDSDCQVAWGIKRQQSGKITDASGQPISDSVAGGSDAYKHIDDYYYRRLYPQAGCETQASLISEIDAQYAKMFRTLKLETSD